MKGTIAAIIRNKCYGFIHDEAGREYFFRYADTDDPKEKYIWKGNTVEFDWEKCPGEENPRAFNVRVNPEKNPRVAAMKEAKREAERTAWHWDGIPPKSSSFYWVVPDDHVRKGFPAYYDADLEKWYTIEDGVQRETYIPAAWKRMEYPLIAEEIGGQHV